jgi:hypothetical protein
MLSLANVRGVSANRHRPWFQIALRRRRRDLTGGLILWALTQRSEAGMSAVPWVGETEADVAGRAFGQGCGQHRHLHIVVVVDFGG